MSYTPYYPGGWKDWPDVSTPITSAALAHIEAGISAGVAGIGNGEDTLNTIASSGATQTLDISTGATQDVTLTANCTFTFANPPAGTGAWYMTLLLRQDATGSRTVTWPAITWLGSGIAPTLQTAASAVDSVVVFTDNDGGTWYGVAQTSASGLKAGTSFPVSPSDGDLFYRSDTRILYEYDSTSTHWLSLDRKYVNFSVGTTLEGTTNTSVYTGFTPVFEDIYIEKWAFASYITATNNGSNYWTVTLNQEGSAFNDTPLIKSVTTASDTVSTLTPHITSVAQVITASSCFGITVGIAKTGTPGAHYVVGNTMVVRSVG